MIANNTKYANIIYKIKKIDFTKKTINKTKGITNAPSVLKDRKAYLSKDGFFLNFNNSSTVMLFR